MTNDETPAPPPPDLSQMVVNLRTHLALGTLLEAQFASVGSDQRRQVARLVWRAAAAPFN
jgi:hypothetical protein